MFSLYMRCIPPFALLLTEHFQNCESFLGSAVSAGRAEGQSWGKHGPDTPSDLMSLLPPVSGKTIAQSRGAEPTEDAEGRTVLQFRMDMHGQVSQQSSVL